MGAHAVADRQHFREVLAGLAAKTLTRIPALNGRVEKACKLVLGADVTLHPDGTALVNSLTDPTRTYQVSPGLCRCKDYDHAPEHLCAHRLAVGFTRKIQELLARETPQVPVSSTDGENLPEAPTPEPNFAESMKFPEAPASATARVLLGGYEVLLTVRDTDAGRLLDTLQGLLWDRRIQPVPKPAPRAQGQWRKRQYQGA
jgi:hypothetical protein